MTTTDKTPAPSLFRFAPLEAPDAAPLRLLTAILAAGSAIFLLRMLAQPAYGVAACLLIGGSLWPLFAGPGAASKPDYRLWAFAAALALALCLFGGEGRLFYANVDWQNRDAILADMARLPWPLAYRGVDGGDWVMRAPLGMYVLPGLGGRLLGWQMAHPLLLLQNAVILSAVLVVFLSAAPRWRERLLIAAVAVAFSGWDLIGQLAFNHFAAPPAWAGLFPHLENWGRGLQYSSLVTDLFWAPHHALPAFAMAAAYLCWRRGTASWLHLAAITGLSVLWSPLAVLGAAPFVVMAGLSDLRGGRMGWLAPLRLAPLAAGLLPLGVYVTLATGAVEHGANTAAPGFFVLYAIFVTLEVAPLLYLAWRQARGETANRQADWWLAAALLLLIPLFKIGQANDLMMRGSIFPITLLAIMAAQALAADLAAGRQRRMIAPLLVLAIGAATPAAEIARALTEPVNPPKGEGFIAAWENSYFRDYSKAPYLAPAADYARWGWLLKQP